LPALAGASLIFGAGMIESGVTIDYGQLVMDNEFARMIKHCLGGIVVNDETLAVDDIVRVGQFGDFLSLESTLKHMREGSQPRLLDRRVREEWLATGATDLHARSLALARELIATHRPEPLPEEARVRVRTVVARADRELAGVQRD
jgi:trimethylamine---corrinoid protein Co-methyltransferase